jgi:AcrR family transcriptional regulator
MAKRESRKANSAPPPRRLTRAEKLEETRRTIIVHTARLVGKYGYAATSTARIARAANVAQGTIFNYFETRQELFDILLPTYAEEMLSFIREEVDPNSRGLDREVERLRAFLDFVRINPWVVRLVNESQALAPKAFAAYFTLVTEGYVRALQRSVDRGEIGGYEPHELEAIAIALLAARSYYAEKYVIQMMSKQTPHWVYEAYRKFVRHALFSHLNKT